MQACMCIKGHPPHIYSCLLLHDIGRIVLSSIFILMFVRSPQTLQYFCNYEKGQIKLFLEQLYSNRYVVLCVEVINNFLSNTVL